MATRAAPEAPCRAVLPEGFLAAALRVVPEVQEERVERPEARAERRAARGRGSSHHIRTQGERESHRSLAEISRGRRSGKQSRGR